MRVFWSSIVVFFLCSPALADCPDVTKHCSAGSVGWQGQCYHKPSWTHPFGYCGDCGHGFCPKPPGISDMPKKAEAAGSACRKKLIEKKVFDGCSWDPKDPASRSFKFVFDDGACNEHDICYTTPGMKKSDCDDNFEANMKYACESFYFNQIKSHPFVVPLNAPQLGLCETAAPFWKAAVVVAGLEAYQKDQKRGKEICE